MTGKKYNMTTSTNACMWRSDDPPTTTKVGVCKGEKTSMEWWWWELKAKINHVGENIPCVADYQLTFNIEIYVI